MVLLLAPKMKVLHDKRKSRLRPLKPALAKVCPDPEKSAFLDKPDVRSQSGPLPIALLSSAREWLVSEPQVSRRSTRKNRLRSAFVRIKRFFHKIFRRKRRSVSASSVIHTLGYSRKQWDMTLALFAISSLTKEYFRLQNDPVVKTSTKFTIPSIRKHLQLELLLTYPSSHQPPVAALCEETDRDNPLLVSIDINCLYPFRIKTDFVVDPIYPFTSDTVLVNQRVNVNLWAYLLTMAHINPFVFTLFLLVTCCPVKSFSESAQYDFIPRPFVCGSKSLHGVINPANPIEKVTPRDYSLRNHSTCISSSPCSSADIMSPKGSTDAVTPATSPPIPDDNIKAFQDSNANSISEEHFLLEKSPSLSLIDKRPVSTDLCHYTIDLTFSANKSIDFTSCGIQTQKMIREEAFSISSSLLQRSCTTGQLKQFLEESLFFSEIDIDDNIPTGVKTEWGPTKKCLLLEDGTTPSAEVSFGTNSLDWYDNLRLEEENIGINVLEDQNKSTEESEAYNLAFVTWVSERFPKMLNHTPTFVPPINDEVITSRHINVHFNNNYDIHNLNFQQDNAVYRQVLSFENDTPPAEFNLHSYDINKTPGKGILKRSATTQNFNPSAGSIKVDELRSSLKCDFNSLKNALSNVVRKDIRLTVKKFSDIFEALIRFANHPRLHFLQLALESQKQFAEIYHVTLGIVNEFEVVVNDESFSPQRVEKILDVLFECKDRLWCARQKTKHLKDSIPAILSSFISQRREIFSQRKTILPIYFRFVNENTKKYRIRADSFHKSSGKWSFDESCKFLVSLNIPNLEESLHNDTAQLETAGVLVEYMSNSLEERLLALKVHTQ